MGRLYNGVYDMTDSELAAVRQAITNTHAQARGAEYQLYEAFEADSVVAKDLATRAVSRVAEMLEELMDSLGIEYKLAA